MKFEEFANEVLNAVDKAYDVELRTDADGPDIEFITSFRTLLHAFVKNLEQVNEELRMANDPESREADEAFDGGEFSSPARDRAIQRLEDERNELLGGVWDSIMDEDTSVDPLFEIDRDRHSSEIVNRDDESQNIGSDEELELYHAESEERAEQERLNEAEREAERRAERRAEDYITGFDRDDELEQGGYYE